MNNSFTKQKDPVELVVFLLGCFLVIMIAFFVARGDLEAYTGFLLGTSLRVEAVTSDQRTRDLLAELERASRTNETAPVRDDFAELIEPVPEPVVPPATPEPERVPATPVPTPVTVSTSPPVAEQPSAPAPITQAGGSVFVQAGAFSQRPNADRMVESLRGLGYQAVVLEEGGVFKVQVPGLPSMEEAGRVVQQLRNQGIESFAGR